MRKLFLVVCLCLLAVPVWGASGNISVFPVLNAVTVAASGAETSRAVDLGQYRVSGYFSIQVAATGDGTCKFEYLMSNDGTNFVEPSTASDIASGVTKTSGLGGDGKDIYVFYPEPARYIKIKCTETGTSDSVTVTVYLFIQ